MKIPPIQYTHIFTHCFQLSWKYVLPLPSSSSLLLGTINYILVPRCHWYSECILRNVVWKNIWLAMNRVQGALCRIESMHSVYFKVAPISVHCTVRNVWSVKFTHYTVHWALLRDDLLPKKDDMSVPCILKGWEIVFLITSDSDAVLNNVREKKRRTKVQNLYSFSIKF